MEDMFYFTKKVMTLDVFRQLSDDFGYKSQKGTGWDEYAHTQDTWVNVIYSHNETKMKRIEDGTIVTLQRDGYWQFFLIDSCEGLETCAQEKWLDYAPATAVLINYRENSLHLLLPFLQALIAAHGGWVGINDECLSTYNW